MTRSHLFKILATALLICTLHGAHAAENKDVTEPAVKKSDAGICHDKSSTSYGNTKKFTSFSSMEACLQSGGRASAGVAGQAEAIVKKSESGICHDKDSASYARTQKYTEFKTLDACLKSGGTLPKK